MKKILFFSILSGALLLFATAQGQYKYIYKPRTTTSNSKKTYQLKPKSSQPKTATSVNRTYPGVARKADFNQVPPPVTDPPIINDSINIYEENPTLIKAYMVVHFGNLIDLSPAADFYFEFDDRPDYYSPVPPAIMISQVNAPSGLKSNTAYNIPLYSNSSNHWTVTYQDFLNKWINGNHDPISYSYRASNEGGFLDFQPIDMAGMINKVILVLQFASGTKTIVFGQKGFYNAEFALKFDQNFHPMQ